MVSCEHWPVYDACHGKHLTCQTDWHADTCSLTHKGFDVGTESIRSTQCSSEIKLKFKN